jgi:orotate phosphoribosyltransferase
MFDYRVQVLDLLKLHSVKVAKPGAELFKLTSGEMSRFYIDVKKTALSSKAHLPLAYLLYDELAHGEFGPVEAVAGVALGGCHLASIVGLYAVLQGQTQLDVVYVRKEAKDHGAMNLVEHPAMTKGARVVLLEDVVTTGGSSVKASGHLTEVGYDVRGVLAVIDRREHRAPVLSNGLPIRSIFTLDDFHSE